MGRLAWSQVRFRPARTLALLAGVLVAAAAFTVLTAASRTAQLRTVGEVSAHFAPAYDILVRPRGARTAEENKTGTVEPDFQSGIYGGITMAQYHQIQQVPGVEVAAPIAMVGYAQLNASVFVPVPAAALAGSGRQLYRISTTWVSDNGASRVTQPPGYLYVTPRRLTRPANGSGPVTDGTGPGCPAGGVVLPQGTNPFGTAAQSYTVCWSRVNRYDQPASPASAGVSHTEAGYRVTWTIPVLIAAIDPDAEAELDGLNRALVSGGYLKENEAGGVTVPVLASSASGMNEYAQTILQQLAAPSAMPDMNAAWESGQASAPGRTVATVRTTAQQAYNAVLKQLGPAVTQIKQLGPGRQRVSTGTPVTGFWSVGPVDYQPATAGTLRARQVVNPPSVWYTGSPLRAAMDDEDSQYRTVTAHTVKAPAQATRAGRSPLALIKVAGVFDPVRIRTFDPLSQVPLGGYQPVVAAPATAASRRALHGGDLLPSQNLGGLVSQPVNLITTLAALPKLENSRVYTGVPAADPISVIRVRVAGVTGPDALSRERVNAVAQQIAQRTGLEVDIVAGSSPSPVTIELPAGKFGQPPLTLSEDWVKKGVAVAIINAIDKTSVALFTLILVVCVLFVGNAATAAVRGRRRELGILAAVGWRRSRLFATVLGELAGIGLAAGLLAAAIAMPASAAIGLSPSPERALLAVPVAIAVAVIGGLVPAWAAARADPVVSVRPPVLAVRRAHQPGGITALAALNVTRTPGRTAIGLVSLAVGVAALTLLTAVTFAFRGVVVGSLLGNAVAVQVRGVDYIAAGATVALGVLAVADVVFLNITERAAELATMRSFGWRDTTLARLVITEGAIIGVTGSLVGAGAGLGAAAWFAGQLPARLLVIAAAATAAGILITATAALAPAALLRRLPTAHLLAEE
jgi:putative ABC transport system permease protein